MTEFVYGQDPIAFCRDRGYPLADLIVSEKRKKALERVSNQNYVNSKYKLKELFAEMGIIVIPEAMTYVHPHDL